MLPGLENIFNLCLRKKYELLVIMEDFEGNSAYASYSSFFVGPEADGYRLQVTGFTEGNADAGGFQRLKGKRQSNKKNYFRMVFISTVYLLLICLFL